jgi:ABC-type multidrug transport system fused ATPase/permease subunit
MGKLSKNRVGLVFGTFLALAHAVWAIAVAIIPAALQSFIDWIFTLHSLKSVYVITSFNLINALMLVVMTFVMGYVFGWVFSAVWNWIRKSEK